jgi:large subunit ribosomal protein L28
MPKIGEIRSHPVKSKFVPPKFLDSGALMARVCDICGKGPQFGNTISHAHNTSRRRWNVNLRPVRAIVNGATRKLRVCTSCLRSGKVAKA